MSQVPSAPFGALSRWLDVAAGERRANGAVIDNIQVLRALAAALVVFVHLEVFLRAFGLLPFGHGGVDLFFVISGFIMVYTTRQKPVGPGAFLLNRFVRIAPLYWVLTAAVYAVALVAPSLLGATSKDPVQLCESFLFIPFRKSNGLIQPVLFVGWTLNYEMFFYALFAVGLLDPKRERGVLAVIAALVALVALGRMLSSPAAVYTFYTDPVVLEFGFGMALALSVTRLRVTTRAGRLALLALGALALVTLVTAWYFLPDVHRVFKYGIPAALIVAIAITLHQSGLTLSNRLLLALGNASFALYLTHPFVAQAAQKLGNRLGLNPLTGVLGAGATFATVCLVGIGTHLALERPLTSACRRLLVPRRDRGVAVEPSPLAAAPLLEGVTRAVDVRGQDGA
jgi:exopolysaccharide production protein ExoZ